MIEFSDVYASDLTSDLLILGSIAMMILCLISTIWMLRARDRAGMASYPRRAAGGLLKKTT
jgi:hypothetical protein